MKAPLDINQTQNFQHETLQNLSAKQKILNFLSLATSLSTLLCCALPALLVSLGLGATFLSLTQTVPQIIWIGEHKKILFLISFILLTLSSVLAYSQRNAPCPLDPQLRDACLKGRTYTKYVLILSWFSWCVGFFFAFLAVYLLT